MEGEKKNVWVWIVVAVMVVGGLVWFMTSGAPGGSPTGGNGTTNESPKGPDRLDVTHEALGAGDVDVCKKLQSADDQAICKFSFIVNQAKTNNDPSVCNQFDDQGSVEQCKDQVIVYRAISTQNAGLCASVSNPDLESQCVKNITGQ